MASSGKFYQTFKAELKSITLKDFSKKKKHFLTHFMKTAFTCTKEKKILQEKTTTD